MLAVLLVAIALAGATASADGEDRSLLPPDVTYPDFASAYVLDERELGMTLTYEREGGDDLSLIHI